MPTPRSEMPCTDYTPAHETLGMREHYLDELTAGVMAVAQESYGRDGPLIWLEDEKGKSNHADLVDLNIAGASEKKKGKAFVAGLDRVAQQAERLSLIAQRDRIVLGDALDYWSLGGLEKEFDNPASELAEAVSGFFMAAGRQFFKRQSRDPLRKPSEAEAVDMAEGLKRLVSSPTGDEQRKLLVRAAQKNAYRRGHHWSGELARIKNKQDRLAAKSSGAPKLGEEGSIRDPKVQDRIDHVDRVLR